MQTLLGWCDFSIVKAGLNGLIRILITGMNGTWVGEVVGCCRFSVFSAWKAWEVGECARAKPPVKQKVQLKASRNRVRGRDRGMGERAEVFSLCHRRVKVMARWCEPCPCQSYSLAVTTIWPPWYHTDGCQTRAGWRAPCLGKAVPSRSARVGRGQDWLKKIPQQKQNKQTWIPLTL